MPQVSMGETEGVIEQWLVAVGAHVQEGDALVIVEMAKAAVEVAAPATGVLSEVLLAAEEEVSAGMVVAYIETGS